MNPKTTKPRGASAKKAPQPAELTVYDRALITRKELARKVSLSMRTLDTLQKKRAIPVIKLSPRCCRFSLEAVLRALGRFEVKEATR